MLYHFITLDFLPDATLAQHAAAWQALQSLPAQIPEMISLTGGLDAGFSGGEHHLAFVAMFASEADWRTYQSHPAHREVIATYLAPILQGRATVQVVEDA